MKEGEPEEEEEEVFCIAASVAHCKGGGRGGSSVGLGAELEESVGEELVPIHHDYRC